MTQRARFIQVSFPNPASQLGILHYTLSPEEKWVRFSGFTNALKACHDSWRASKLQGEVSGTRALSFVHHRQGAGKPSGGGSVEEVGRSSELIASNHTLAI